MNSTSSKLTQVEQRVSYQRLLWVTLLAGVLAALANTVIYYVGDAASTIPKDFVFSTSNQPLSAGLVAVFSFTGVLVGGGILAGLNRITRRPITFFRIISLGFLLLFAAAPLTIGATISMVLLLEIMHLVAGVIAITMLTTLPRRNHPIRLIARLARNE